PFPDRRPTPAAGVALEMTRPRLFEGALVQRQRRDDLVTVDQVDGAEVDRAGLRAVAATVHFDEDVERGARPALARRAGQLTLLAGAQARFLLLAHRILVRLDDGRSIGVDQDATLVEPDDALAELDGGIHVVGDQQQRRAGVRTQIAHPREA